MKLKYPVNNPLVIQPFGYDNTNRPERHSFYTLFNNKHPGVDFKARIDTKIYASYPGIVVRREFHKGMGKVIGTRYGSIVILYAHLNKFGVNLGQVIKQGELIGYSGNSGMSTQPHLHFEIRDITKPSLKEMVLDPHFGKELVGVKEEIIYVVNNTNKPKTLSVLAEKYFGTSETCNIKLLKASNANLNNISDDEILSGGLSVVVPNY